MAASPLFVWKIALERTIERERETVKLLMKQQSIFINNFRLLLDDNTCNPNSRIHDRDLFRGDLPQNFVFGRAVYDLSQGSPVRKYFESSPGHLVSTIYIH